MRDKTFSEPYKFLSTIEILINVMLLLIISFYPVKNFEMKIKVLTVPQLLNDHQALHYPLPQPQRTY